jgi:hypothetical protein
MSHARSLDAEIKSVLNSSYIEKNDNITFLELAVFFRMIVS